MDPKIVWSKEYSVGIAEIDEQHQQFIEIANDILEAAKQGGITNEAAMVSLGKLGNYALYHFSTEEEYFIECKFAGAAEHIAAHNRFKETSKKYLAEAGNPQADLKKLLEEAALFSGKWLLGHILTVDKKYSENFSQCGLK